MLVRAPRLTGEVTSLLAPAVGPGVDPGRLGVHQSGGYAVLYGGPGSGALICAAGVRFQQHVGVLPHLATEPSHQGRGYAAALITAIMGERHLTSWPAETGDDAVGFYRRAGFRTERRVRPWPRPGPRRTHPREPGTRSPGTLSDTAPAKE